MKAHLFRLSGQTVVYGLAGASLPLIGLITLPVFTHVFTTRQYGALEIVVVAAGALAVVIDLGPRPRGSAQLLPLPRRRRRRAGGP